MKVTFFDTSEIWHQLLPLTYTKPCSELRLGILTLREKWLHRLSLNEWGYFTEDYLSERFPNNSADLWINGAVVCDDRLAAAVTALKQNQVLMAAQTCIAALPASKDVTPESLISLERVDYTDALVLDRPWKIFLHTAAEIRNDFTLITRERTSAPLEDEHTIVYGRENLFLEPGVQLRAAIIDATNGPVYLGKNSSVGHGAIIRGALALGENSVISMGAKMRGDSSIGPNCKVGGEVSNSTLQANSNKAHDGYLGNAVIGEWCNLGADTNASNLKNNYSSIKAWDYREKKYIATGLKFCGLIMGDHSKCSINTMFNTGTVAGVSANIFGSDFPPKFIPSFSWGGGNDWQTYHLDKAIETAENMLARRNLTLDPSYKSLLRAIFERSKEFRTWES